MDSSIVRKIDRHGRIVLPKDVRIHMGVEDESLVEIVLIEDGIIIKNFKPESDLLKDINVLDRTLEDYMNEHDDEKSKRVRELLGQAMLLLKNIISDN
ncbi:AbrB/MazE/SpoVT family DNA-binding domain-containing protein [Lacrimispora sp.]|uniref:AbrB/MazE/SpoVT family DNA-binding domain-containing protein n=1 Tax=Lacrimispora sp. TaxID=2719234 RepID=UPI003994C23C